MPQNLNEFWESKTPINGGGGMTETEAEYLSLARCTPTPFLILTTHAHSCTELGREARTTLGAYAHEYRIHAQDVAAR